MSGMTSAGLVAPTATEIAADIDAKLKAGPLGATAGTEADGSIPAQTVAGQIRALIADPASALWEGLLAVNAGGDPATATGAEQDALYALDGLTRHPATYSAVYVYLAGTNGTSVSAGSAISYTSTDTRWVLQTSSVLAVPSAWQALTAYGARALVTNGGKVYVCTTAGTSANAGGPTNAVGTSAQEGGGSTPIWYCLGTTAALPALAVVSAQPGITGPVSASPGSVASGGWTIATPVSGWTEAITIDAATLGEDAEADDAFRVRRESEIGGAAGNATVKAIRRRLLELDANSPDASLHMREVVVFQNTTMVVNGDGLPPKSVEVLIDRDTSDPDTGAARAILDVVAAGIETYGGQTATLIDDGGQSVDISYSRPTEVPIYVAVTGKYRSDTTIATPATTLAALVKSAIYTRGLGYPIGLDVWASTLTTAAQSGPAALDASSNPIAAPATAAPVPDLLGISSLYIDTAPVPVSSAPITITSRQRATIALADITVTLTSGTP